MERGILDKKSLERDISQIEFYSNEEVSALRNVYSSMMECCKLYRSTNGTNLANELTTVTSDIEKFSNKRINYPQTLNKTIQLYDELSNATTKYFGGL
ncbi:MAG TPA: hypothetical protein DCY94_02960 [Firmicutes bacterium]|nr:hypothetical protein [Bacillota bacterium]